MAIEKGTAVPSGDDMNVNPHAGAEATTAVGEAANLSALMAQPQEPPLRPQLLTRWVLEVEPPPQRTTLRSVALKRL